MKREVDPCCWTVPLYVGMTMPTHGVEFVANSVTRSGGHVHRGSLSMEMYRGGLNTTSALPFDGSTGVRLERSMAHEIRRKRSEGFGRDPTRSDPAFSRYSQLSVDRDSSPRLL